MDRYSLRYKFGFISIFSSTTIFRFARMVAGYSYDPKRTILSIKNKFPNFINWCNLVILVSFLFSIFDFLKEKNDFITLKKKREQSIKEEESIEFYSSNTTLKE